LAQYCTIDLPSLAQPEGADTPVPVPVPVPDLSGGRGRGVRPRFVRNRGLSPVRGRPRFAEIGDQARAVVLEYPKGVEGFAQVWSRDSQITRRTGQLCPDIPTFPIWLAIAPSTRRRQ
jgi:hypothetical protein